jgi:hypothetical protein
MDSPLEGDKFCREPEVTPRFGVPPDDARPVLATQSVVIGKAGAFHWRPRDCRRSLIQKAQRLVVYESVRFVTSINEVQGLSDESRCGGVTYAHQLAVNDGSLIVDAQLVSSDGLPCSMRGTNTSQPRDNSGILYLVRIFVHCQPTVCVA